MEVEEGCLPRHSCEHRPLGHRGLPPIQGPVRQVVNACGAAGEEINAGQGLLGGKGTHALSDLARSANLLADRATSCRGKDPPDPMVSGNGVEPQGLCTGLGRALRADAGGGGPHLDRGWLFVSGCQPLGKEIPARHPRHGRGYGVGRESGRST